MVEEQHQFFNLVHVVFFKRTLVWWPTDFLKIGAKDEGKRWIFKWVSRKDLICINEHFLIDLGEKLRRVKITLHKH